MSYSHEDFLREFECKVDREFKFNGHEASWALARGQFCFWDEEDDCIDIPDNNPIGGTVPATALALTPDEKILAVSINTLIRTYDVETLEMCAELLPCQPNVDSLQFQPNGSATAHEDAGYTLISQSGGLVAGSKIYKIMLNGDGRPINGTTTLLLANASLPLFGSRIWSRDGKRMLYVVHPESTQLVTRPRVEPPEIVIFDMVNDREICRLRGHGDAIMWASWSLDSQIIATASWDGTYGLWNAWTGEHKHTISTQGHNWSGAFLSDGIHILLSGSLPHKVGIYNIETAELLVSLQPSDTIQLGRRLRNFAVHPSRDLVVLSNGRSLLAWTPFEQSALQLLLTIRQNDDQLVSPFGGEFNVKWVDRGRKLVAQGQDQTIFVWEPDSHRKWRFQRPKGRAVSMMTGIDVLFVQRKGSKWVLSMGENRVRFWKLESI